MNYAQIESDQTSFAFAKNTVDLVTFNMSMHYIKDKKAMLTDVRRILKPGGHLFLKEHDVPDSDIALREKLEAEQVTETLSPELSTQPTSFISRDDLRTLLIDELFFIHAGDSVDRLPPEEAE